MKHGLGLISTQDGMEVILVTHHWVWQNNYCYAILLKTFLQEVYFVVFMKFSDNIVLLLTFTLL